MEIETIQKITVYAIPLIFAITLHEAAHAFAARYFGDSTAYLLGRMTLNPIKHIDPVWTIVVPLITLLISPFVFGAAKPVPVNFGALRRPKQDMIWVAAAGPAANLLMMLLWALVGKFVLLFPASGGIIFVILVAKAGIFVNAILMVFNLFPLLPLDGGRILAGLLPARASYLFGRTEPYGMFILVGLILTGVMGAFLWPLVDFFMNTVYSILNLR
ncbi:MAG: site-2 protease family protein [Rhodocyclaceae bacterium]|jgi:Zn-dependent protease|nr:site-2 protease family protein [Rhodocyclaceae bacterium]MCE2723692.1 site-2 protease family protein [Betaproteobacteria bacterium]MCA3019015.1 site-2 protease family protein [Rhodocyclaceae bacterium]MCA3022144.1 site-2 protease family protein [Rhodocyclaceae bacterium]MCA3024362.1 site-2 protease family protein [Rhodocyclaceae bacterium]